VPAVAEWFVGLHPVAQALLAGCFTWFVTALGAALVFPFRNLSRGVLDAMLGFAAGVMIAASVWSLLLPAIELTEGFGGIPWAPAAIGVAAGALALRLTDRLLPHLHPRLPLSHAEGPTTTWRRTTLLVLAITMHNAPEGLAVGVAFGAAALGTGLPAGATLGAAIALAIGIAIQNFPEGVAVAMPLRREGVAPWRCFWYGQLSAVVEPFTAALGAAAVLLVAPILPYALAFAAGAMLFVVVEELIPESQQGGFTDLATTFTIAGFVVMMVLDVALG
jgi:ZIP family zinc transporter